MQSTPGSVVPLAMFLWRKKHLSLCSNQQKVELKLHLCHKWKSILICNFIFSIQYFANVQSFGNNGTINWGKVDQFKPNLNPIRFWLQINFNNYHIEVRIYWLSAVLMWSSFTIITLSSNWTWNRKWPRISSYHQHQHTRLPILFDFCTLQTLFENHLYFCFKCRQAALFWFVLMFIGKRLFILLAHLSLLHDVMMYS